ncbi:MAG: DUF3800 domain-containing protein [Sulfuricaulis sp.]
MMLKAYFDDSGSHRDGNITVMGGLIGSVDQWEFFEQKWTERLANPLAGKLPLKKFHFADCKAIKREFEGYSNGESAHLSYLFRQIIIDAGLASTVSVIDRKAWDELITGKRREILGGAIEVCFNNCVARAMNLGTGEKENNQIAIVFDQGIQSDRMHQISDMNMLHVGGNPWITSITFGQVEQVLPLQGADIVATESYWHGLEWLKSGDAANMRAHFQHFLDNMMAQGLILGRTEIEEEVRRCGDDGRLISSNDEE